MQCITCYPTSSCRCGVKSCASCGQTSRRSTRSIAPKSTVVQFLPMPPCSHSRRHSFLNHDIPTVPPVDDEAAAGQQVSANQRFVAPFGEHPAHPPVPQYPRGIDAGLNDRAVSLAHISCECKTQTKFSKTDSGSVSQSVAPVSTTAVSVRNTRSSPATVMSTQASSPVPSSALGWTMPLIMVSLPLLAYRI